MPQAMLVIVTLCVVCVLGAPLRDVLPANHLWQGIIQPSHFFSHPDFVSLSESGALPSKFTIFLPLQMPSSQMPFSGSDDSLFIAASHICEDEINEFDLFHFPTELSLMSLSGISIVMSPGVVPTINGVAILEGPLNFDGGNIFIIDRPLTPIHTHGMENFHPEATSAQVVRAENLTTATAGDASRTLTPASIIAACTHSSSLGHAPGCAMTAARVAQQTILSHGHPALSPAWRVAVSLRPIQAMQY